MPTHWSSAARLLLSFLFLPAFAAPPAFLSSTSPPFHNPRVQRDQDIGAGTRLPSSPSYGAFDPSAMPKKDSAFAPSPPTGPPVWFQKEISVTAPSRGCHLITSDVQKEMGTEISCIKMGLANLFIQHTSASLTVNENADPDVRIDMETALNRIGA